MIANNLIAAEIKKQIGQQKILQGLTNSSSQLTLNRYSLPSLATEVQQTQQRHHRHLRDFLEKLKTRDKKVARVLESSNREKTQLTTTSFFANISPHTIIFP